MRLIKAFILSLILLLIFVNCDENKITSSQPQPQPIADFSIDRSIAEKAEVIHFTNNSQNASSYSWDFGDGHNSTEINPNHQYSNSGIQTIRLTAINDVGNSTTSKEILVKEFTIMTYNIAFSAGAVTELYEMWNNDGHGAWNHDRRPDLLKVIRDVNPDILGLQEAFCWDSYDPPVYKSFADSLGMEYYYYLESEEIEWNGICIYSKYPIISTDFLLHQPCVQNQVVNGTYMVKVKLNIDNKKILDVLVCHLMAQVAGAQTCEIETLTNYRKSNFNPNTILMGDMNFVFNDQYYELLLGANLNYLSSQGTSEAKQIDQIWASKGLYNQSIIYDGDNIHNILNTNEFARASDHWPVVAHFGFK